MRNKFSLALALIATFVCGGAGAAIGNDGIEESRAQPVAVTESNDSPASTTEAAHFRQTGAQACVQAVDAISAIGETFHQITLQVPQLYASARDRYSADVEPAMRELRDRVHEAIQRA